MNQVACLKCGSLRLHRSRRKSWMESAAALAGWRTRRCRECNARFLQCGTRLTPVTHLNRVRKRLLAVAAVAGAIAVVLMVILYLSRPQATPPLDGIILPL
jgi:hypothetical protein